MFKLFKMQHVIDRLKLMLRLQGKCNTTVNTISELVFLIGH